MNKRQSRLSLVRDIVLHNQVGSQEDLLRLLASRNCNVTQATLSRDLKSVGASKVSDTKGGYRYIIPDNAPAPALRRKQRAGRPGRPAGSAKVQASKIAEAQTVAAPKFVPAAGNAATAVFVSWPMIVIRTRAGYASSVAADIDSLNSPLILGSVAGIDCVMVAVAAQASHRQLFDVFCAVLPERVMLEAQRHF